ncbi:Bax inhibitor-1/YccA family protein [Cellulomonas wangsupingiae]|uniref:Bax inhibitor-1/YccA family protein n=1 Tax=Cellulomonas wangsupingiae TaxID=2968085 RepID=A0ABY5K7Y4_9CELL|nr:Bax inhibitor-1/YccA family protein [Cellulomonas wangsupingiae]MCC2334375.1 Bax inhibitor-1/YccA family protein [Cellulomonas wangsupingiae]MCM0640752.1 Bax inhibitor-1/YccA family protein [Cellulomonas wangsupingiae]UUI66045.1 Bax inhibitor-1/YccA family protein [Cellulomonas wangsupingiae]
MSNPVFNNSPVFGDPRQQRRGGGQAVAQGPAWGTPGAQAADAATLEQLYDAPPATPRDTGRLTYDDVIVKTGGLLALLTVVAAATWTLAPGLWIIGAVVGLVLGLVNAFKKNPSPVLITLYTVAQGVFLGGISAFYESFYNGIVGQAVLATLSVFAVALVLFRSGKVRVTPKFQRAVLIGMVGYLVYSLLNVVLMVFGVGGGTYGPLRSGFLGIIVGLVAVGLAAASLIMDFDSIKRGVEQGAPAKFAWSAAFGLIVTLIWLYLELLRLLAILRGDS